ncbi:MAG: DUF4292 domain-containing protein [Prevotellaceae bacterium]|jgi:hypothetical protein|nr:DUF4292 domain-containing protein [Prevotellaceae bacterium]
MKKYIYITAVFVFALTGCKTKQRTSLSYPQTTGKEILSTETIINQILNQQSDISFANISNAEALVNYNGKNLNIKLSIKIITGKEISISILPILGIEMFKVQLMPKKFYIFDKLNRQYCENAYDCFSYALGAAASYSTIEALFLNRLFTIDSDGKEAFKKAFTTDQKPDKYLLQAIKKVKNLEHSFEVSPDFKITGVFLNQKPLDAVSLNYSNFDIKNGVLFPMKFDIKTVFANLNASVNFEIKKMEINKEFETSTLDISHYQKVDCRNILN